ncbi:MAG: hypothetical protein JXR56_05705 [Candidatus Cloacimonetes bacterium]|nr:hypothetical protein [Candidatus Cloacimonadota bacterium]
MNLFSKLIPVLALMGLLLYGCSENPFNPVTVNNISTNTNYDFSTPTKTIENLVRAYEQLNTDLFKSCLAEDFRFELIESDAPDIGIDMDGDGIKDSWWGYQQEIRYHENLFENGSSDNSYPPPDQIILEIPTNDLVWTDDTDSEGLPNGYKYTDVHFSLTLQYNSNGQTISSNGFVRFYLVNKSITDTPRWSIIIWRDNSWL